MLRNLKKLCLFLCTAILLTVLSGVKAGALDYKFNMSYIYFGGASGYIGLVDKAQNSLNEVAPNYFNLDEFGNLVTTNAASKTFVEQMHQKGIKVVPFLSNHWLEDVGIAALENRVNLAKALAQAADVDYEGDNVVGYNLDGICIDLENLKEDQRANYVDFVRQLHDLLEPMGKTVTVAVAANPNGYNTGWQGSYDYAELAKYSDYLLIMAYDEFGNGVNAAPVASISFVENSIKYALTKVPKEKIVLGLAFYGRMWSDSGSYPKGEAVNNKKVDELIANYGGKVTLDSRSKSAKATFTVKPSDIKPKILGKTLEAGTYTIWYENEQTLKEKLALVEKYDIKGAGSWSLGQESDSTWNYYKLWLNGCTFGDIQNNWAKDYILNAYMNNWVKGVTPETFVPDASLTRAEAATMLVRMLGLPVDTNNDNGFDDIKGSWAEAYINTARRYNIISGIGNNQFAPDKPMTRQEIAVMLNNYFSYTASGQQAPFSDVSSESNPWSYTAIYALSENKIITGYPDGRYGPQFNVTRAEMTALLSRINKA